MSIVELLKVSESLSHTTQKMHLIHAFCSFILLLLMSTSDNTEEENELHFQPVSRNVVTPGPHVLKATGLVVLVVSFLPPCVFFFFPGGGEGGGWKNYFQGTSTRFLITLTPGTSSQPLHRLPAAPPSPQGECVFAERASMGGGGARVFNNAAFKCCLFAHILYV